PPTPVAGRSTGCPVGPVATHALDAAAREQRGGAARGQDVEHAHLVPGSEEPQREVRADESRAAGDQDPHAVRRAGRRPAGPAATTPMTFALARRSQAIASLSSTRSVARGSATSSTASARAARSIASPEPSSAAPTFTLAAAPAWA